MDSRVTEPNKSDSSNDLQREKTLSPVVQTPLLHRHPTWTDNIVPNQNVFALCWSRRSKGVHGGRLRRHILFNDLWPVHVHVSQSQGLGYHPCFAQVGRLINHEHVQSGRAVCHSREAPCSRGKMKSHVPCVQPYLGMFEHRFRGDDSSGLLLQKKKTWKQ